MDLSTIGQPSPFLGFQSLHTPDLLGKFPRPESNGFSNPKLFGKNFNGDKWKQDTQMRTEFLKKVIRKGDASKPHLKKKKPNRKEIGEYELSSDDEEQV